MSWKPEYPGMPLTIPAFPGTVSLHYMDNSSSPRRVAVLGSSGSIGQSSLEVIAKSKGQLVPLLLSVHRQTDILAQQLRQLSPEHLPRWIAVTDETADRSPLEEFAKNIEIAVGHEALCELVRHRDIDIVLSAIVGSAGLTSTLAALESGKTVALANKESLVMGGKLLTDLAQKHGGRLIPVDSEHSAIMQALCSWRMEFADATVRRSVDDLGIAKIILTASGGPFRTKSQPELENVSVAEALAHPTWKMGKKITIDSATLMNKALEIIETRWFFDVPAEKIDVVIHPQSLIHSMVEFIDGSVIAQMSPPDMRLPIQLALYYPHRVLGIASKIDWTKMQSLELYPPDFDRFPALLLGLEVAASGGTAGAVINAANESAVSAFLAGRLPFLDIVKVCRLVLEHHHFESAPTLEQLLAIDRWARGEVERFVDRR
ncbi:MAG: 1-deoxy-D-xylulose-5-phosphate reductoisomerase [Planctomycetaceae bacterium]|nr:1-deoxy-D-xylulose-5-phosphate reductoisomerase [Planctomycetaceae bacterium]